MRIQAQLSKSAPELTNERGIILISLYAFVLVSLLIFASVFTMRSLTDVRSMEMRLYQAQAMRAAEAGMDRILQFYQYAGDACRNYTKATFEGDGTASVDPICLTPGNPLPGGDDIDDAADPARIALTNAGGPGMRYEAKIEGVGSNKAIVVRGYGADGPNAPSDSFAEITVLGQAIVNPPMRGLVGLNGVEVGQDSTIIGDITTTSTSPGAIHIRKRTTITDGILRVGPITPSQLSDLVGTNIGTNLIVLDDDVTVGDITGSPGLGAPFGNGAFYENGTVGYGAALYRGNPLADLRDELSQPINDILADAGIDPSECTSILDVAGHSDVELTPNAAGGTKFCYKYIRTRDNVDLRFQLNPSTPVAEVYVIEGNPDFDQAIRIGQFNGIWAFDSSDPLVDPLNPDDAIENGVHFIMANSDPANNKVLLQKMATFHGSIIAPTSEVTINSFTNSMTTGVILADFLRITKQADYTFIYTPGNCGDGSPPPCKDGDFLPRVWFSRFAK